MKIALTGRPGIGKTTACLKIYERIKDDLNVSGFVTLEVREKGKRVGFKLKNLLTGEEDWLAKVGEGKIKVGKYAVFVDRLERFLDGVPLNSDVVIIDEVGPMELKSKKFVEFIEEAMNRENVVFTIHLRSKHPLLERIRREFRVYTLTEENRNRVVDEVVSLVSGRR